MEKVIFDDGSGVEIYTTKDEMINVLSDRFGRSEIMHYLDEDRFKDSFNPETKGSNYIKKIIKIVVPNEDTSLMCLKHWNYTEEWPSGKIDLNIDTYSSGFACISFRRPKKTLQNCFIKYYNMVRDDNRIEEILKSTKIGKKMYFENHGVLSVETISDAHLDCEEELVVKVSISNNTNDCFEVFDIRNGKFRIYCFDKRAYSSLEYAKQNCISSMENERKKLKEKIVDIEKKIAAATSFGI